jgi:Fic family protein
MIAPYYQVSSETLNLVSEISEQIGILGTLSKATIKTAEAAYNPLLENDLLRAHEKMSDGLNDGAGYYRQDNPRIRLYMAMLFDWLNSSDVHPLIKSCIFHYELATIRPFLEGNERLGLYWQTLLLIQWRPILSGLSFEAIITEHQQEYRRILAYQGENAKTSHFIEFILGCLLDIITQEVKNKVENKVKNKSREKVQDNTPENPFKGASESSFSRSEQRIIKLLATDSHITIGLLAQRLQLSEAGINKALAALRKKGIIERVGANKNGSWKVNI